MLIMSNSFVATKFYAEPDDICDPVILFLLQWMMLVLFFNDNRRLAYFVQNVLHNSNVSKNAFSLFS